jgi:hypothetical protein
VTSVVKLPLIKFQGHLPVLDVVFIGRLKELDDANQCLTCFGERQNAETMLIGPSGKTSFA